MIVPVEVHTIVQVSDITHVVPIVGKLKTTEAMTGATVGVDDGEDVELAAVALGVGDAEGEALGVIVGAATIVNSVE